MKTHSTSLCFMASVLLHRLDLSFPLAATNRMHRFGTRCAPLPCGAHVRTHSVTRLWATSTPASLPDIDGMSAADMRKELERYGISTKSFLEKKELVQALTDARARGTPPKPTETQSTATATSAATSDNSKSRAERIEEEVAKATRMKVSQLKQELEARGVSTKSFFEKSDFVKAYAEAIVDNVSPSAAGEGAKQASASREEPFDPSYRDVTMQKFDGRDPRLLSGVVIDVPLGR